MAAPASLPLTAEQVANIEQHLVWARGPENLAVLPAERALMDLAASHDNLAASLRRCARLIGAMRGSKKFNWTFEQQHALEDHYGEAMHALALAEGRL